MSYFRETKFELFEKYNRANFTRMRFKKKCCLTSPLISLLYTQKLATMGRMKTYGLTRRNQHRVYLPVFEFNVTTRKDCVNVLPLEFSSLSFLKLRKTEEFFVPCTLQNYWKCNWKSCHFHERDSLISPCRITCILQKFIFQRNKWFMLHRIASCWFSQQFTLHFSTTWKIVPHNIKHRI